MSQRGEKDQSSAASKPFNILKPDTASLERLDQPDYIRAALVNRGLASWIEADRYLHCCEMCNLSDPFDLYGVEGAACFILSRLQQEYSVVIFGDYDADGITGTSILLSILQAISPHRGESAVLLGRKISDGVSYYIPNRHEGYGLSDEFCDICTSKLKKGDVVITVDCGISCHKQVNALQAHGLGVVITDHHPQHGDIPPDANHIVHPSPRHPLSGPLATPV